MVAPGVREKPLGVGMEPATNTPEQFADFMKSEIGKWARVVKTAGIRVD